MEKQKRFNIQRKISYEEELSEENKKVTEKGFTCGILAIWAVVCLYRGFNGDNYQILNLITGGLQAIAGCFNLIVLRKAIIRKTVLQGEIKDIDAELRALEIKTVPKDEIIDIDAELEMCEGTTEKEENRGIRK